MFNYEWVTKTVDLILLVMIFIRTRAGSHRREEVMGMKVWNFDHNRIKTAREVRDLNQAELARKIGASPQQVSAWETGIATPGQDSLTKICNALQCPPKFFFVSIDDDNHQNNEREAA